VDSEFPKLKILKCKEIVLFNSAEKKTLH